MPEKKTKDKTTVYYIAIESAITNDGPITPGEIATPDAVMLKKYPKLFKPLTVTYTA